MRIYMCIHISAGPLGGHQAVKDGNAILQSCLSLVPVFLMLSCSPACHLSSVPVVLLPGSLQSCDLVVSSLQSGWCSPLLFGSPAAPRNRYLPPTWPILRIPAAPGPPLRNPLQSHQEMHAPRDPKSIPKVIKNDSQIHENRALEMHRKFT